MTLDVKDISPSLALAFGLRSSILRIQDEVAQFYGIQSDYMRRPDGIGSRDWRVSRPRQVAMFLAHKITKLPTTEIGRRFGGRDHSTVIYARKAVEKRAASDPYLEMELELLSERLTA